MGIDEDNEDDEEDEEGGEDRVDVECVSLFEGL